MELKFYKEKMLKFTETFVVNFEEIEAEHQVIYPTSVFRIEYI